MKRIFSGIQPTGETHLGNYLGAIRNWRAMQHQADETLFCLVDWHAMTVWQDPQTLRENIFNMAAVLVACGIDTEKSILFVQSDNPAHSELCWLLCCVARIGWLNRMTQFKEKAGKDRENASVGLYIYPVLMAADILLYHANLVPVGEDQRQHLELARDIAQKFNNDYRCPDFFPLPEEEIQSVAARVMSLRDGTKKMSKSDSSDYARILLTDDSDTIALKIRKAKTDPEPLPDDIRALDARPEAKNLLTIYAALHDRTPEEMLPEWAGKNFSDFKPALTEALVEHLLPIGAEITRLHDDREALEKLLRHGAERARAVSTPVMAEIRRILHNG